MVSLLFFITTVICGFGWFMMRVVSLAILYYMKEQGYTIPNESDMRRCVKIVFAKMSKK